MNQAREIAQDGEEDVDAELSSTAVSEQRRHCWTKQLEVISMAWRLLKPAGCQAVAHLAGGRVR